VIRALADFLGHRLTDEEVCALAYEVEKVHHGTPSGIDNTVIAFARPIFFQRRSDGNRIETFKVARPFLIAIGDTGINSPTVRTVGDVRAAWQADSKRYESLFAQVGALVQSARQAIETGAISFVRPLDGSKPCIAGRNRGFLSRIRTVGSSRPPGWGAGS